MTEDEEKKELRRAQSAFRTAKTYVNRYGEPEGLRELKALIEGKLGDAPAKQEEPTKEERQQALVQELMALRDAQQRTTEQVLNVKEEVLKVHRTQGAQAKQLEDAAMGAGASVVGIVIMVILAVIFFIKSFF